MYGRHAREGHRPSWHLWHWNGSHAVLGSDELSPSMTVEISNKFWICVLVVLSIHYILDVCSLLYRPSFIIYLIGRYFLLCVLFQGQAFPPGSTSCYNSSTVIHPESRADVDDSGQESSCLPHESMALRCIVVGNLGVTVNLRVSSGARETRRAKGAG